MVKVDKNLCIGCNACARDCPRQILALENEKAIVVRDNCNTCGHCFCICPKQAVSYTDTDIDGSENVRFSTSRLEPDDLLKAIKGRRSIRHFKNQPVEQDKLLKIIEAARFTPSGANLQGTGYIIIQDKLQEITKRSLELMRYAAEHPGSSDSPLLPSYANRWIEMEQAYSEKGIDPLFYHAPVVLILTGSNTIDTALAASNAELMTFAQRLGCVYVGFFRFIGSTPEMREILGLEPGREAVCCLALGYPDVEYYRTAPRQRKDIRFL